jgi:hypothetical protein
MNTQVGYLIKRTMKPSQVALYDAKAKEKGAELRHYPEYMWPHEGYGTKQPPHSLRIGWYTADEAAQALAHHRTQAEEHGYLVNWEQYDYQIVKVTVTEEDA